MERRYLAHPTADISLGASIGDNTRIWQQCQVREGAAIGRNCILGKGVYVDAGVRIGDNAKIQNGVSLYHGVTLEDGVFCGPHAVFTNDRLPRAVDPDGTLKGPDDWAIGRTVVRAGASIGANATIVCGVTLGRWAMVGAGAVVTHDVPDYGLVYGNPARLRAFVCPCGRRMAQAPDAVPAEADVRLACPGCSRQIHVPRAEYERLAGPEGVT